MWQLMELRDFAEQILFATTLEEKLQCPEAITDERPGPSLVAPRMPGRPLELRFKESASGRGEFPGAHRLEDERDRGRLLHFFANHELLATELMALVLLRFPDAPAAFRRGVLQTLKDEQEHTRWYIERMGQCGIHFGDLPVSGYFWRAISGMENPMEYVAGLSLTFEQANLDFAQHFARGFAQAGDADTAALLEKIYRDEIGHVAYGLKWFRRWKNPAESDWEAFCRQLKFPLSPTRAKGLCLNVEGRRAAGFDDQFIDELSVHSQSRGRTPNVFVFNPFAEPFIAQGSKFTPGKHQAELACDLANLPQFLCRRDDVVLVPERPSTRFLSGIQHAGFALPEFVVVSRSRAPWWSRVDSPSVKANSPGAGGNEDEPFRALAARKLGSLRPWAWGPDSAQLLAPLFPNAADQRRHPDQCFNEGMASLYSKAWSANFLRKVLGHHHEQKLSVATEPWLCPEQGVGTAVNGVDAALNAIGEIRSRGHHRIVIKQALGLAGHNAIRLWEPQITEAQRRWMAKAIEQGNELVIEPWLERVLDFSIQLEMTPPRLMVRGYTGLVNDAKGQFQANRAEPNYAIRCPAQVAALLRGPRDISSRLHSLYGSIVALLEDELRRVDYVGPLGIDAFVYRTAAGEHCLKPIVEINPRYTMGRLLIELMQRATPGTHGIFRLMNSALVRAAGFKDLASYAGALRERCPLRLEGEPEPRMREGALCLNDPEKARSYLGVFQVSARADEI
jgi:uncharacterized ferritin-like protein (DUF455 family)